MEAADIQLGPFLTGGISSILFSPSVAGSLSVLWKMNLGVEQSQVGMLSFKANGKLGQPDSSDP